CTQQNKNCAATPLATIRDSRPSAPPFFTDPFKLPDPSTKSSLLWNVTNKATESWTSRRMILLTSVIISTPALVRFQLLNKRPTLHLALTDALWITGLHWAQVMFFLNALSKDPEGQILTANPTASGQYPTQPQIDQFPFVQQLFALIDLIPDAEWGARTAEIRGHMKQVVRDLYTLESSQNRAMVDASRDGFPSNNDKQLFAWLSMSSHPPDFAQIIQQNLVWRVILCQWAVLCQRRKSVWYFKGILPVLYNMAITDINATANTTRVGTWAQWKFCLRPVIEALAASWIDYKTPVAED
ncbi:hypothetical protein D6D10_07417, partial [Aureobasidium pullulans]